MMERVIISGGGTGGHIFPGLAIADEIKSRYPDCQILFVGALGKMEMEKVPNAGYEIVGLNISGIQRRLSFSNLWVPFKLFWSLLRSFAILRSFKPQLVIGTGGYASVPVLYAAQQLKIKNFIQEQNAFPGLSNRLLGKKADMVFSAYQEIENFIDPKKVVISGNPVRKSVWNCPIDAKTLKQKYALDKEMLVVLVIGGSLGARTINQSMDVVCRNKELNLSFYWQTGINAFQSYEPLLPQYFNTHLTAFIENMGEVYAMADIIISRAGAIAISELAGIGKPVVLVPSPNVTDNHQYKNALALKNKNACILIEDKHCASQLLQVLRKLSEDEVLRTELGKNLLAMAKPSATETIVEKIEAYCGFK